MPSDSNYAAVKRHCRPLGSRSGRPAALDIVDDKWASDKLSDDEVDVARFEVDAGGFEEGELDADAIVVSPAANSASNANTGMTSGVGKRIFPQDIRFACDARY